jgi:hypothetical protein
MAPRGIRNNNFGNIEDGPFAQGLPGYTGTDGRFATFDSPDNGWNAMSQLLSTYSTKHGLNTPAGVISRWAPSSDGNDPLGYAATVSKEIGVGPNDTLDMSDPNVRMRMARAMANVENGAGAMKSVMGNKMAGLDDYLYGDPTPKGRGALFAPPQGGTPAPQEQPSFLQNLLNNGTGAFFGVPNSEGLGSQLQNAGAGLMAINNPSALSLIAASRAKQATAPYEIHIGRDGTAYRINKANGEVTKLGNDKQAEQEKQQKQTADVVTTDIDRVGNIVNGSGLPSTGPVGSVLQGLPGTNSHDVNELLRGIKSNVGFDRLQQMRASSPTGGALGAVSDTENKLLQSALGSLEQSQSKEQFMQNLSRVKQIYGQIIHGPNYKVEGTPSGGGVPGTAPVNIPGVRSIKQIN